MELGVDWKHPQTAQAAAGWGGGGGGVLRRRRSRGPSPAPSSSSWLFLRPHSPPNTLAHGLSRCSLHSGRWRQTEGHGQREPRGRAARRPPQRCEREAEARGALSKAPRRRPAPVAPPGARWPARAGTPGAAGAEPERSWPGTGPGQRPERERSPKGRAEGRPAGLGGRERGWERRRAGGRRAGGRAGGS